LSDQQLLHSSFVGQSTFRAVLANGSIVLVKLNHVGDIARIVFDKFLQGRISEPASDSCWLNDRLVLVHPSGGVTFVSAEESDWPLESSSPKVTSLADTIGPQGRR